ncbi:TRAP transporter small permease subunit [Crenalkalicoccus roseus]|uniref:TRAP transporter small permease subunit n=1 Tax=Crenalkalicoccus roseus TaxID=1485588 RepID=UPI0010810310|nr:TRAP transporter small permease subunit [Crenalkalicoccus roseus]
MRHSHPMPEGAGGRALALADRALLAVETACAALAGLVIFVLMFAGVLEIIGRGVFNAPIYGHLDMVELTMISYTVLCVSYCWRKAAHVRMDLLLRRLSGRGRWVAELLATGLALYFVTLILPGTWQYFLNAWQIGDSTMNTGLPTWPSKLAVPVGLGVLWLRLALEMLAYLRLIADPALPRIAVPTPPDPTREAVD